MNTVPVLDALDTTICNIKKKSTFYAPFQMDLLEKFSRIDSGTGNLEGNQKTVQLVCEALTEMGATVRLVEAPGIGTHIIARMGSASGCKKIVLGAHLDTVFAPGEAALHPFRTENNTAYGLGIADCKGGVAVSLFAVRIAHELGILPPDLEIVMLYNCDEEIGSASSQLVFAEEARGADYAFVFEPGRGKNGLLTSRRGCAVGSIDVTGKDAHAGLHYLQGADANLQLALSLATLCAANQPKKGLFFNVGIMRGGDHVDIVSDSAHAEFFVNFASNDDILWIQHTVDQLSSQVSVQGCSVRTEVNILFPPMERNEANVRAFELVRAAGNRLGLVLPEESSEGSSDACWYSSLNIPTVDALGPYMDAIHTVNESLQIHTIQERTELVALVLASL